MRVVRVVSRLGASGSLALCIAQVLFAQRVASHNRIKRKVPVLRVAPVVGRSFAINIGCLLVDNESRANEIIQ